MDCCNVIKEGKPVFELGRSFVVDFSGCGEELTKGGPWFHTLYIWLEGYRREGCEMGAETGTIA